MKVREALALAAARLAAVSDTPRLEAELLMATALGVDRDQLLLRSQQDEAPFVFGSLVDRRLAHEPIAYIVGRRGFWTIDIDVGPGALVPRPDSETLIEAAIAHFADRAPASILDLGTGPGTLLLAGLDQWPQATGLGVDCSEAALAFARRNAQRLGLAGRAEFRLGNWAASIDRRFDLILCNPPYVAMGSALPADVSEWEPAGALFAGPDGLDAYRRLAPQLAALLESGGVVCVEIGLGQEAMVADLFAVEGFTIASRTDLQGVVRCLILTIDRK